MLVSAWVVVLLIPGMLIRQIFPWLFGSKNGSRLGSLWGWWVYAILVSFFVREVIVAWYACHYDLVLIMGFVGGFLVLCITTQEMHAFSKLRSEVGAGEQQEGDDSCGKTDSYLAQFRYRRVNRVLDMVLLPLFFSVVLVYALRLATPACTRAWDGHHYEWADLQPRAELALAAADLWETWALFACMRLFRDVLQLTGEKKKSRMTRELQFLSRDKDEKVVDTNDKRQRMIMERAVAHLRTRASLAGPAQIVAEEFNGTAPENQGTDPTETSPLLAKSPVRSPPGPPRYASAPVAVGTSSLGIGGKKGSLLSERSPTGAEGAAEDAERELEDVKRRAEEAAEDAKREREAVMREQRENAEKAEREKHARNTLVADICVSIVKLYLFVVGVSAVLQIVVAGLLNTNAPTLCAHLAGTCFGDRNCLASTGPCQGKQCTEVYKQYIGNPLYWLLFILNSIAICCVVVYEHFYEKDLSLLASQTPLADKLESAQSIFDIQAHVHGNLQALRGNLQAQAEKIGGKGIGTPFWRFMGVKIVVSCGFTWSIVLGVLSSLKFFDGAEDRRYYVWYIAPICIIELPALVLLHKFLAYPAGLNENRGLLQMQTVNVTYPHPADHIIEGSPWKCGDGGQKSIEAWCQHTLGVTFEEDAVGEDGKNILAVKNVNDDPDKGSVAAFLEGVGTATDGSATLFLAQEGKVNFCWKLISVSASVPFEAVKLAASREAQWEMNIEVHPEVQEEGKTAPKYPRYMGTVSKVITGKEGGKTVKTVRASARRTSRADSSAGSRSPARPAAGPPGTPGSPGTPGTKYPGAEDAGGDVITIDWNEEGDGGPPAAEIRAGRVPAEITKRWWNGAGKPSVIVDVEGGEKARRRGGEGAAERARRLPVYVPHERSVAPPKSRAQSHWNFVKERRVGQAAMARAGAGAAADGGKVGAAEALRHAMFEASVADGGAFTARFDPAGRKGEREGDVGAAGCVWNVVVVAVAVALAGLFTWWTLEVDTPPDVGHGKPKYYYECPPLTTVTDELGHLHGTAADLTLMNTISADKRAGMHGWDQGRDYQALCGHVSLDCFPGYFPDEVANGRVRVNCSGGCPGTPGTPGPPVQFDDETPRIQRGVYLYGREEVNGDVETAAGVVEEGMWLMSVDGHSVYDSGSLLEQHAKELYMHGKHSAVFARRQVFAFCLSHSTEWFFTGRCRPCPCSEYDAQHAPGNVCERASGDIACRIYYKEHPGITINPPLPDLH